MHWYYQNIIQSYPTWTQFRGKDFYSVYSIESSQAKPDKPIFNEDIERRRGEEVKINLFLKDEGKLRYTYTYIYIYIYIYYIYIYMYIYIYICTYTILEIDR